MSSGIPIGAEREAGLPERSSTPPKGRKVRSACERCRSRRIKCDGDVPACGNCSKAGVLCVDVDSRVGEKRVVRGFSAADASARIAWLEQIIRSQLPHVKLDAGPAFPNLLSTDPIVFSQHSDPSQDSNFLSVSSNVDSLPGAFNVEHSRGQKRPASALHDHSSPTSSVEQDARSVALDLDQLSLKAESRQVHYLGASSGSLFASLFQARRPERVDLTRAGIGSLALISETDAPDHQNDQDLNILQYAEMRKVVDNLYGQLRKDLPSREECNVLLNRFFQHMHSNHPFLHQPSFITIVDNLYKCAESQPNCEIQYNGWPADVIPFMYNGDGQYFRDRLLIPISAHVASFQLLVALSVGATLQIRARKYTHNPTTFFNSAISLAQHVFGSISLPVLQAVLLLALHGLMDPEGLNIWTLSHTATAYAIDLGIHREVGESNTFGALSMEMRRRIFYCVYTLDRAVSTIQGRPLGLGDDTFDVQLPRIALQVDTSSSQNTVGTDGGDIATMPYSLQVFKMSRLISRIKVEFYHFMKNEVDPIRAASDQQRLRKELDSWLTESLSIDLRSVSSAQRARLSIKLKIQYHAAMCLLHQPSQKIVRPNNQAFQHCFDSAIQRIRLYEMLYDSGSLFHSWRTVHDMFLAGVSIMYSVFLSKNVRQSVSIASLARDFRSCSTMLSVGGEWWPIIRKARVSFERLLNHTLEMFSEDARAQHTNFPEVTRLQSDLNSDAFASAGIVDALTSLINHDKHFPDILDSFPQSNFIDSTTNMTLPLSNLAWDESTMNDDFWSILEGMDFQNAMSSSRADARNLQDYMSTLSER